MAGKKRGRKTKEEKLNETLAEVDEAVAEYEAEHKEPYNEEFPQIVLPCRKYFRENDEGSYVRNLQIAMNHIMCTNVPVTGMYDAETMKAVELFEEKYGGCVNGRFGETELIAYNKLRGAK